MGGSGGSIGRGWKPDEIARQVREAEKNVQDEQFKTGVAGLLGELLAQCNERDTKLVNRRLDEITAALQGQVSERIEQIFGGSVAKHTYVDGLSDIDCLLILNKEDLAKRGPTQVLAHMASTLQEKLKGEAEVSAGKMAVTVRYGDNMEIQLLPATQDGDGVRIPSSRRENQWSSVDPKSFHQALTKYNQACDGKLVPTIKLAKAVLGQLPETQQLSGYHVESLAIDAFKNYSGTKSTSAMLPCFFEHAKERVLRPMTDSTGQSVHVDGHMGDKDSRERKNASHVLGRIAKRIANATAASSLAQWRDLFGIDE